MMALDFFAGNGSLLSRHILNGYDVEAWDKRGEALDSYVFKDAKKLVGDSFKLAETCQRRFDVILIDSPAGPFGGYCEHFEALDSALPLLKNEGTVILNIFTSPLRYLLWQPINGGSLRNTARRVLNGDLAAWNRMRRAYYAHMHSPTQLRDYLSHYRKLFLHRGFKTRETRVERRGWGIWLTSFKLTEARP